MVIVYFETPDNNYAEIVAAFENEDMYNSVLPLLKAIAKENRLIVTESIVENKLNIGKLLSE